MNLRKSITIKSIALALTIPLILMFFADAECAQGGQISAEELLLEIMDLHSELVTNEIFLAQAKMLGAYLEAAQPQEEAKKIIIYKKVLDILLKVKDSTVNASPPTSEKGAKTEQKAFEGEKKGKSVFVPGAALLEIFKFKGHETSLEQVPDLPVIRTYWKRDLACSASFVLPERLDEVGEVSAYAAKFSFYYEAKQPGKYGLTILHNENNVCMLKIGGVTVVEPPQERGRGSYASVYQGVCNLEKGFHRVEFWLVSRSPTKDSLRWPSRSKDAEFQVKILTPDAFDAVPITKDMMLLKKE